VTDTVSDDNTAIPTGSRHDQPAVDIDRLAGNVGGIVAGEESHQPRNIFAGAGASHRDTLDPFRHQLARPVVAKQLAPGLVVIGPHVSVDDPRTEGIHGDALLGQLLGEALGYADHPELRCGVMRGEDETLARLTRGGVRQDKLAKDSR
jgi:hypothetical protein